MEQRYGIKTLMLEIFMILLAVLFFVPVYFVLANAFKTLPEVMFTAAAWPNEFHTDNFVEAWAAISFPSSLLNSVIINIFSIFGLSVIGSMAAWRLVRYPGKISALFFLLFVSAMVIPFQSIMIPLVQVTKSLGLINSLPGLIIMYYGFGISFTIFIYHGFIKTVPLEVEEAAVIDGCSTLGLFWRVVFPLLKPVTVTSIILNSLWIWNDFLLPLLVLNDKELRTIPLAIYSFFGVYSKQWHLAMATLTMSSIPVIVLFLVLQKQIIKGIAAGSVKG